MNAQDITSRTAEHVQQLLSGEGSGHDWWHIYRVRRLALRIAEEEGADLYVVELAALLHDIADHKFHRGDESVGPARAREWLESLGADEEAIAHVCEIIRDISFKGAGVATPMRTLEGKAVQDADRLDAIGAIGIARAFAYGGHKGRALHDPAVKPVLHASFEQYKGSDAPTLNHFYEKLLLLTDALNTASARRIAERRHEYMVSFLEEFLAEWDGER